MKSIHLRIPFFFCFICLFLFLEFLVVCNGFVQHIHFVVIMKAENNDY